MIPFYKGETVAAALTRAGILNLGHDALGNELRYFCGIGACQNCLVHVGDTVREACLTPARQDLSITSVERSHAGD
ncbi:(2Fe-2S)-binding protein [Neorhizobium sp. LjRoot104]